MKPLRVFEEHRWYNSDIEQLKELAKTNTFAEIATKMNLSFSVIKRQCNKLKIKTKKAKITALSSDDIDFIKFHANNGEKLQHIANSLNRAAVGSVETIFKRSRGTTLRDRLPSAMNRVSEKDLKDFKTRYTISEIEYKLNCSQADVLLVKRKFNLLNFSKYSSYEFEELILANLDLQLTELSDKIGIPISVIDNTKASMLHDIKVVDTLINLEFSNEIWKSVKLEEYSDYRASSHGRVMTPSGKISFGYFDARGNRLAIKVKGTTIPKSRLVYSAFNDDYDETLTIDHINEVAIDDRPENLQQLTHAENSTKGNLNRTYNNIVSSSPYSDFEPYEDEIFLPIDSVDPKIAPDMYSVSNYGRLVNNLKGKLMKTSKDGKYLRATLKYDTDANYKFKKMFMQRLVALVHIGEIPKGYVVNHIDGNTINNDVNNLEIVTNAENVQHAFDTGLNSYGRVRDIKTIRPIYREYYTKMKNI